MNKEQEIINFLINVNNSKDIKKLNFIRKNKCFNENDLILGVHYSNIKEYLKQKEILDLNCIHKLLCSSYNEIRLTAWGLLIKNYKDKNIIKDTILNFSQYCGNWNVVDFAAPLCAKSLIKNNQYLLLKNIGYSLIEKENIWSNRFALMLSIKLIEENNYNYAIDCAERLLIYNDLITETAIINIMKKIKEKNEVLIKYFIKENSSKISLRILEEFKN